MEGLMKCQPLCVSEERNLITLSFYELAKYTAGSLCFQIIIILHFLFFSFTSQGCWNIDRPNYHRSEPRTHWGEDHQAGTLTGTEEDLRILEFRVQNH